MRYLIALTLLISTQAYADRYLSDGNGGFYVYRDQQGSLGQNMYNFGNRGGLLSRIEQNRQTQLQNDLLQQHLELLMELERLKRTGR